MYRLTKAEASEMSPFTVRSMSKSVSTASNKVLKEQKIEVDEEKKNEKDKQPAWTIEGMVQRSLEPSITHSELKEYKR